MPIPQMRKSRLRAAEQLTQGYAAWEWRGQDTNWGLLTPNEHALPSVMKTRILPLLPAAQSWQQDSQGRPLHSPGPAEGDARVRGGGRSAQTKRKEGSGSSTEHPLSSQERRPHCPHKCPQIVRARASSGPQNIWPQNNMTAGGGEVGGWAGGANEEGSTQPPEENLIVWGLPWVLLIKKKKNLYLNANLC